MIREIYPRMTIKNCKTDSIIFPFILVLFSFITDFYFCQNSTVPFEISFAKKHFDTGALYISRKRALQL